MSEFKGTPGPWEMKKEKGEPEWFVFQKGSMKKMCFGTIRTPVAEEINNKHDAKLISAAPELLEALQAVVRVADRQTDEFDMARSAIAKALGK
ncbi:TPA: hypothetical protein ACHT5R_005145 [Citrobacter freundii]|nr:hypothetical protein [Citrobacter freundii]HBM9448512.1 hypothetical protein [Citrobacter freundii]